MESANGERSSRRVPVSVLTGFLGSGKTTVLNHLTQHADLRRSLVLINEFGDIGLDHELFEHSAEEVVIEMSSGCLCCTIRGDLVRTLREATERLECDGQLRFDRVVIETTGLADPAPILHTLMTDPLIAHRYRLDGVIATVDVINGEDTLNRQFESVKQVAVADRVLLTKSDIAEPDALLSLQERVRNLNPAAPQIIADNGAVDPHLLFDVGPFMPENKAPDVTHWLRAEAYEAPESHGHHDAHHIHDHHHDVNRHDPHIKAVCITIDDPIRAEKLEAWLEMLLVFRGADFLRIKGIINVVELDVPLVIHGVQHIFHPPIRLSAWPSDDHRSRIVFITRDIDESVLRNTLRTISASGTQRPAPLPPEPCT